MPNYITEGTGMRILLAAGGVPDSANIPQAQYMKDSTGVRIAEALENGGGGGGLPSGGNVGDVIEKTANGAVWSDSVTELKSAITGKQAAPSAAGTAGQVLGLDNSLNPVWVNQSGGDIPSGGSTGDLLQKTAGGYEWSGDIPTALALKPDASDIPVSVVTPASGSTFTLDPCPVTYMFGEKAELTVTVTATSQFHFAFSCPSSAATVLTITGETMRCGDTLEAGKLYEVDIWAGITRICEVDGTAVTP